MTLDRSLHSWVSVSLSIRKELYPLGPTNLSSVSKKPNSNLMFSCNKGFPSSSDGKESTCNAGDPGSIPGSGRSSGEELATHFRLLPIEFHGQRSLSVAGYSPWGRKELDLTNTFTFRLFRLRKIVCSFALSYQYISSLMYGYLILLQYLLTKRRKL